MAQDPDDEGQIDPPPAVREAIIHATEQAGEDDAGFMRAMNAHYEARQPAMGGRAVAGDGVGAAPPAGLVDLRHDPRYQANARKLAERILGGTRVVGGEPVKGRQFLDCVAVGSDAEWGCTGTLIAPNVVVTAGHCANYASRVFFGRDVGESGKVVAVAERHRHPEHNQATLLNDLMILVLAERVTTVDPRRIAAKDVIDQAGDGRIVGFGNTNLAGTSGYGEKRFVDVAIASAACLGEVNGSSDALAYQCFAGSELVAGHPLLNKDSCNGDSGGPFYVQGPDKTWLLAAATSRPTADFRHPCGDGGIYVRLDAYRAWIMSLPGVQLPD